MSTNTSTWISEMDGNIVKAVKLFKIPDPREPTDRDEIKGKSCKGLKLNGSDSIAPSSYPISKQIGSKVKPTIRIKRIKPEHNNPIKYLKGASQIQDKLKREKERAEKALKLNSLFN